HRPPTSPLFPYTTLFRSCLSRRTDTEFWREVQRPERIVPRLKAKLDYWKMKPPSGVDFIDQFMPGMSNEGMNSGEFAGDHRTLRSEEHTSELQSRENLVC